MIIQGALYRALLVPFDLDPEPFVDPLFTVLLWITPMQVRSFRASELPSTKTFNSDLIF